MREFLQIFVFAAVNGTFYALFAIGIALLYRGTRAVNFAVAQIAAFGLYAFWWLSTNKGMPILIGLAGALVFGVGVTLLFEQLIVRRIPGNDRTTVTVASVGLLSFLLAIEAKFFSGDTRRIAAPFESGGVEVVGVNVSANAILGFVLLMAVAFGLTTVLRKTDFGLGVLAVAQDRDASRLMGVPAVKVSMFLWGTGAAVAVLGGWLVLPNVGNLRLAVFAGLYTKSLIGAVIGGLDSIWGAVAGAFAVALIESATLRYISIASVPGVEWLVMLAAVLAVLLIRPTGLLSGIKIRGAA